MIGSLRVRFIAVLLLFGGLASALTGALVYTHMHNISDDYRQHDRVAQFVANAYLLDLGATSETWNGLDSAVEAAAGASGVRVVVTDSASGEMLADSNPGRPLPNDRYAFVNPAFDFIVFPDGNGLIVETAVLDGSLCDGRCFDQADGFSPPIELYVVDESGDRLPATDPATVGLVAVVLAAAATVAAFSISRRLTRPLQDLTAAAAKVSAGQLDHAVKQPAASEIAKVTAAFNQMTQDLQRSETARTELVADLAHEFRNPIGALIGVLEGAQDGLIDVDRDLIDTLHSEASHLALLIDDLQDLNDADVGLLSLRREAIDLAQLVQQTVAINRSAANAAKLSIESELPESLFVDVDPARYRQVATNLLQNAIAYTPAGGAIEVILRASNGRAILDVVDTGVGLSPEEQARVFDRLWRADKSRARSTGGSGIGLTVCREIVTAHDGMITVTSAPGEGSTFSVNLPIASMTVA